MAATLAGAARYRELGSVAAGLRQELLSLLGARWDLAGLVFIAPSAGTLRRVLITLDAGELDRAVGAWLREHAGRDADGWAIALDGKHLRGSWNDDGRLVLFSAMTHRTERQDAVVLGQITVPEGSTGGVCCTQDVVTIAVAVLVPVVTAAAGVVSLLI